MTAAIMALGPTVVESGVDYTRDASPVLVSSDRQRPSLFNMAPSEGSALENAEALTAAAQAAGASDFKVLVTGEASINADFGATAEATCAPARSLASG